MAGLFGSGFRPNPMQSDFATAGPAPASTLDAPAPSLQMGQQRRGLFGGGGGPDRQQMALLLAGFSDAMDPFTARPSGGGQLQAMMKLQKEDSAKKAQQEAFSQAFDPATGKLDPAKFIAALSAGGGQVPDALMSSMIPKDRAAQVIQRRDGSFGTLDPDDPTSYQEIQGPVADPNADLVRALLAARVGATEAQTNVRQHQAAKPYFAPPRARSGGGAGRSISPNSVQWD